MNASQGTTAVFSLSLAIAIATSSPSVMNKRCDGSFLRTGDIVPTFGSRNEYVVRIERIEDRDGKVVGWIYTGNKGHKVVQATDDMSREDAEKAGIELPGNPVNRVSTLPSFRKNPWTDLKIQACIAFRRLHSVSSGSRR